MIHDQMSANDPNRTWSAPRTLPGPATFVTFITIEDKVAP